MSAIWASAVCERAGVGTTVEAANLQDEDQNKLKIAFSETLDLLSHGLPLTGQPPCDFVRQVAMEYTVRSEKSDLDKARQSLRAILDRRTKKLKTLIQALQSDIVRSETADEYKNKADLLLSNLYKVVQGESWIDVENWETGEIIHLTLDPLKPPQQQAKDLYRRYRKLKRSGEMAAGRLRAVQAEIEELDSLRESLNSATDLDQIELIRGQFAIHGLVLPGAISDKSKGSKQGHKSRESSRPGELIELSAYRYRSNDGFLILAGKGDRSNDLLRRLARPDDIWLHVRDIPGSHVYIVTRNREVPETTLKEAAMIAAWHSKARDGANVPVDYTRAKYVTSIPGAGPGHVNFRRERTIRVTPAIERIEAMRFIAAGSDRESSAR